MCRGRQMRRRASSRNSTSAGGFMARAGCSMSLLSLECALSPVLVYFSICWSPVELPVGAGPPIEPKNQYHIHCDKIEEHRIKAFLLTCCCISKSNVVFAVELGHWTLVQCCAPGENWFGVCRSSVLLEREEGLLIVLHAHDRPAPRLLRRALLSKRDKAFRMTTKPLEMTATGVETTGKPFGMTGKGVGNRSVAFGTRGKQRVRSRSASGRPGEAESDSA